MMQFISFPWTVLAALLMSLLPVAAAFAPPVPKTYHLLAQTTTTTTTTMHATKNPGAGLPVVPPGSRKLFDPSKEGKLSDHPEILESRLQYGYLYDNNKSASSTATATTTTTSSSSSTTLPCQHWLEDIGLPLNFAKPNAPVSATVLGRARLIGQDAEGDIEHVVLQLPKGMHYVEGQSLSVIPPGFDEVTGKPHKPRLYSIASTRYGDLLDGNTVSLCVRLAEFNDKDTGVYKQGTCSSFLCSTQPGDIVNVAGPVGKTMLLPEDPSKDIIMVATGTGIAPFRGFLHRLFVEETVARHMFTGQAWLILGVPTSNNLLYHEELQAMLQNARDGQLKVDYAISREMKNPADGGKVYVQHVLQQQADVLWDKMEHGAVMYFCGLKGMMPGILEALEQVAAARGVNWSDTMKQWQANGQWHVEVY